MPILPGIHHYDFDAIPSNPSLLSIPRTQKCGDITGNPPSFRASCLAACVALGCADVELLYDNIIRCVESAGDKAATLCANQIAACNAAKCPAR